MLGTVDMKVGLIGLGWPGQQHAKAVQELDGALVAAASDLSEERREQFVQDFGECKLYADYQDLLGDSDIHAVIISLPNFLHYPATIRALESGKHVMCEKPPTLNVAEMESIRALARASGLVYAFSRQSRFSGSMLAARRLINEGRLGRIYFARAERVRSRGIPVGLGGWFTEKNKAGGGAVIDIGVHAIDAAWYLMGCPKPVSVSAQVSANFAHTVPAGLKFDVEDTGFAFIRFEGGAVLHLEVTWAANVTDAVPVSHWAGHELENTTVYGDKGTLRLDPATFFSMVGTERKEIAIAPENGPTDFVRQMDDFLRAIRTGQTPVNNVDQAVDLMKILMGIYESSQQGAELRL